MERASKKANKDLLDDLTLEEFWGDVGDAAFFVVMAIEAKGTDPEEFKKIVEILARKLDRIDYYGERLVGGLSFLFDRKKRRGILNIRKWTEDIRDRYNIPGGEPVEEIYL